MVSFDEAIKTADLHHVRIINRKIIPGVDFRDLSVGNTLVAYVNPLADNERSAMQLMAMIRLHAKTNSNVMR